MKVVLVTRMFPSELGPYSGTFVYDQACELAKRIELTVINPVDKYPFLERHKNLNRKREAIPTYRTFDGFWVYSPDYWYLPKLQTKYAHWNLALTITLAIIRKAQDSQLIHVHNAMPDAFSGAVAGKVVGKPVIVTCHGSDINIWASQSEPRSRRLVYLGLTRASCVIAVSGALKDKILSLGVPESKIRVIPNDYNEELFYPRDKALCRKKLNLPADKRIFLSVGMLRPVKGFSTLLSVFRELKASGESFVAYIVGEGEERDHLASQIRHLGLEGTVFLVGALPRKDVAEWMNVADFLIVSSVSEAMPCTVIESLACGTPVLSTPVGGIPEILNPGVGMVGEGATVAALVDVIRKGIHSRFANEKIAEYARQFKWENVANQVSQLYEDVVGTWQS